jgi:hypothetical protein
MYTTSSQPGPWNPNTFSIQRSLPALGIRRWRRLGRGSWLVIETVCRWSHAHKHARAHTTHIHLHVCHIFVYYGTERTFYIIISSSSSSSSSCSSSSNIGYGHDQAMKTTGQRSRMWLLSSITSSAMRSILATTTAGECVCCSCGQLPRCRCLSCSYFYASLYEHRA